MKAFVCQELHALGKKWVPILDPGIKVEPGYTPYEEGKAATERPGASPDERVFIVVGGESGGGGSGSGGSNTSTTTSSSSPSSSPAVLLPFTGTVWPGQVHYPDFLSLSARAFWMNENRLFLRPGAL